VEQAQLRAIFPAIPEFLPQFFPQAALKMGFFLYGK
jgi:hypothetical protein